MLERDFNRPKLFLGFQLMTPLRATAVQNGFGVIGRSFITVTFSYT